MARHRIVCTEQDPAGEDHDDAHIVAVGVGPDPDSADQRWTVAQVYKAMDDGDEFYTKGKRSGKVAKVRKWGCRTCNEPTLRSDPDAVEDNNLDNLRRCDWK